MCLVGQLRFGHNIGLSQFLVLIGKGFWRTAGLEATAGKVFLPSGFAGVVILVVGSLVVVAIASWSFHRDLVDNGKSALAKTSMGLEVGNCL